MARALPIGLTLVGWALPHAVCSIVLNQSEMLHCSWLVHTTSAQETCEKREMAKAYAAHAKITTQHSDHMVL